MILASGLLFFGPPCIIIISFSLYYRFLVNKACVLYPIITWQPCNISRTLSSWTQGYHCRLFPHLDLRWVYPPITSSRRSATGSDGDDWTLTRREATCAHRKQPPRMRRRHHQHAAQSVGGTDAAHRRHEIECVPVDGAKIDPQDL